MIYIDNSEKNINILNDGITTSNTILNNKLFYEKAKRISKWLPTAKKTDQYNNIFLNRYYIVEFLTTDKPIQKKIKSFNELSFIHFSETIPIIKNHYRPNDEFWDFQYAMPQIFAPNAYNFWNIDNGEIPGQIENNEIVVAVADLPLMWYHPDLINNVWQNLNEDSDGDGTVIEYLNNEWVLDPDDLNNIDDDNDGFIDNLIGWNAHSDSNNININLSLVHGTNVAGCISSMTNNQSGIASIGWSIKIMGITICDNGGNITSGYEGIFSAAQMGADIINNSWGSSGGPDYAETLINTILNEYNCIIVASAGNSGTNIENYPASFNGVVSVTSTSQGDLFSCWATRHETVDIAAPGDNIFTTNTTQNENGVLYHYTTGTSFSAPIVSGALGLIKSVNPHADRSFLISKIKLSASYFNDMDGYCGSESLNGYIGEGQLNIKDALLQYIEPDLNITDINVLNQTGYILPNDTSEIIIRIFNSYGAHPIENIQAYLSTENTGVSIINNQFTFNEILPSGSDYDALFLITSTENMSSGDILFNINVNAELSGNFPSNLEINNEPYNYESVLYIPFGSPQQYGYPFGNVKIKHTPLLSDLNNNSLLEIYFSSDSLLFGTMIAGFEVPNFPFQANSKITTPCSSGDLNNNNTNELVFGTKTGTIYVLDQNGNQLLNYSQTDSIVGHSSLSDINGDGFLDIIFISNNNSTSTIFAINYLGNDLPGFPVYISEKIISGPAVVDIDLNGFSDIIFGTLENNIYAINNLGNIKNGFPVSTIQPIYFPPTLLDLNRDQDIEIVIGDSDGNIYIYDHNGSQINQFSVESSISSSIAIADLNRDGNMELIFFSSDNHAHALNSESGESLDGWPINLDSESNIEPIILDIDNDEDLEIIITTTNGNIYLIHHNGSLYNNYPYFSQDSIASTPSVGDIDNDGDYELIFGTNKNLCVIDINEFGGSQYSWRTYRGNSMRNGFFNIELSELSYKKFNLPNVYKLGNNYPNPFNPITNIDYSIPENINVSLFIYNILGEKIHTLINNEYQKTGYKTIQWNAKNKNGHPISTGVYFYKIQAGSFNKTKKMILIK